MPGSLFYPAQGYLYVSTDWHGNYELFLKWLREIKKHIKSKRVKSPQALILGDVINPKDNEEIDKNGDKHILDAIDYLKQNGFRIDSLVGNHEYQTALLYRLEQQGRQVGPEYYRVFSFLKNMNNTYFQRFSNLPAVALTENRLVFTHGGLPENLHTLEQLTAPDRNDLIDILQGSKRDFDKEDVRKRLKAVGLRYSISGHTKLKHFPELLEYGVVALDNCRGIFTSNIGSGNGRKTGLCINLEKDYEHLIEDLYKDQDIVYLD